MKAAENRDLSPQDLADECQVPLQTIYTWNHKGSGPAFYRAGVHVRYRRADVDAWKRGQSVEASR
jgi:excisionase family DNA binding protein